MKATMSILGLYRYDNNLFDELVLPNLLNKEDIVNKILMDCAELEILYPNADVCKMMIGVWSKSKLHTWNKMQEVLYAEYAPFINIDRTETINALETRDLNTSGITSNASQNETHSVSEQSTSAYDSETYTNREKIKSDGSNAGVDNGSSNVDETGTIDKAEVRKYQGDSGIYTKQMVLKQEMENRLAFDLISIIIKEFKKEFCLLIY